MAKAGGGSGDLPLAALQGNDVHLNFRSPRQDTAPAVAGKKTEGMHSTFILRWSYLNISFYTSLDSDLQEKLRAKNNAGDLKDNAGLC